MLKFVPINYKKINMKTFLLFLTILAGNYGLAQIPTDDALRYLFTNGSLQNNVLPGTNDLTPTGSSRIVTSDANGIADNALDINTDTFNAGMRGAGNINRSKMSLSFWMKTNANTSSLSTIFSQYEAAGFGPYGWKVNLQNGKIALTDIVLLDGSVIKPQIQAQSAVSVADNSWHHIVCVIDIVPFTNPGFATTYGPQISIYADNILQATQRTSGVGATSAALVYTNPNNTTISLSAGTYNDSLDNIRIYNKALTVSEINALYNEFSITQPTKAYVNVNATGLNNGKDWTNAFTSLQSAINILAFSYVDEIWVSTGVYFPNTSDRAATFSINKNGAKIYGGFNGTETQLSNRNWITNPTILSGDLSENDDTTISFTNTLRNDNSYHIVTANANNIILDGFTLSNAHANGTATADKTGAAILKTATVSNLTIKNCIFKNNVSHNGGAGIFAEYTTTGSTSLNIENSEFRNNLATYATSIYSYTNINTNLNINISNTLFDNNMAIDNGTTKGYAGSAGWYRAFANGSTLTTNFTNNTYVNNLDTGTHASALNRATIGLEKRGTGIVNSQINNCIFWNNLDVGNATAKAINRIADTFSPTTTFVNNSLDSDNFSTITNKVNSITTNPQFVSTTNFQLTSGSPAIDAGNNTNVLGTTDLLGNARIHNTTVDMGAYEYDLALNSVSFQTQNNFKIYPNPTSYSLTIDTTEEIKSISIYSLDGKEILHSFEKNIDVSGLQNGMYLVKIINTTNTIGIKKFQKI